MAPGGLPPARPHGGSRLSQAQGPAAMAQRGTAAHIPQPEARVPTCSAPSPHQGSTVALQAVPSAPAEGTALSQSLSLSPASSSPNTATSTRSGSLGAQGTSRAWPWGCARSKGHRAGVSPAGWLCPDGHKDPAAGGSARSQGSHTPCPPHRAVERLRSVPTPHAGHLLLPPALARPWSQCSARRHPSMAFMGPVGHH